MADEDKDAKTEEATPRKREEARSQGQVAQSSEFVAAAMLAAGIGSFLALGRRLVTSLGMLFQDGASRAAELGPETLAPQDFSAILIGASRDAAIALAMFVTPMIAMGFLISYGQVGIKLTPKAMSIDPNKLNPISGFKKIFGPRGVVRTGLGLLKIAAIGTVVALVTWSQTGANSLAAGVDAAATAAAIGRTMLRAASAGVVVILAISLIDLVYQRHQHSRDLRMSKQEIKDEAKNSEGDPKVKARIRQIQREMSSQRMMDDVPGATVVVTNPTHYAVALRYEDGRDAAPKVVAKGLDHVALKIREIAAENGVMIVEEPPLARALHRACEIGDAVPEELFEAVAKLLAYVYRASGQTSHQRAEAALA